MHLVDAATRMQLASTGSGAAAVPFVYKKNKQKMTLYKGEAALKTRRMVASKLTDRLIRDLQRTRRVDDEPDWAPLQQLYDAGIRRNPVTGTAVFNPEACKPALLAAYWRADGSIADTIDTKQMGQTDDALDELQTQLHEHAAQLREIVPPSERLCGPSAPAKRPRSPSPASSLSDEGTDTGEPADCQQQKRQRMSDESNAERI